MKMDVTATLKRSAAVAIGIGGLIFIVLLVWIGGELHYRNCLEEVELKHPVALNQTAAQTSEREDAIDSCSRWP